MIEQLKSSAVTATEATSAASEADSDAASSQGEGEIVSSENITGVLTSVSSVVSSASSLIEQLKSSAVTASEAASSQGEGEIVSSENITEVLTSVSSVVSSASSLIEQLKGSAVTATEATSAASEADSGDDSGTAASSDTEAAVTDATDADADSDSGTAQILSQNITEVLTSVSSVVSSASSLIEQLKSSAVTPSDTTVSATEATSAASAASEAASGDDSVDASSQNEDAAKTEDDTAKTDDEAKADIVLGLIEKMTEEVNETKKNENKRQQEQKANLEQKDRKRQQVIDAEALAEAENKAEEQNRQSNTAVVKQQVEKESKKEQEKADEEIKKREENQKKALQGKKKQEIKNNARKKFRKKVNKRIHSNDLENLDKEKTEIQEGKTEIQEGGKKLERFVELMKKGEESESNIQKLIKFYMINLVLKMIRSIKTAKNETDIYSEVEIDVWDEYFEHIFKEISDKFIVNEDNAQMYYKLYYKFKYDLCDIKKSQETRDKIIEYLNRENDKPTKEEKILGFFNFYKYLMTPLRVMMKIDDVQCKKDKALANEDYKTKHNMHNWFVDETGTELIYKYEPQSDDVNVTDKNVDIAFNFNFPNKIFGPNHNINQLSDNFFKDIESYMDKNIYANVATNKQYGFLYFTYGFSGSGKTYTTNIIMTDVIDKIIEKYSKNKGFKMEIRYFEIIAFMCPPQDALCSGREVKRNKIANEKMKDWFDGNKNISKAAKEVFELAGDNVGKDNPFIRNFSNISTAHVETPLTKLRPLFDTNPKEAASILAKFKNFYDLNSVSWNQTPINELNTDTEIINDMFKYYGTIKHMVYFDGDKWTTIKLHFKNDIHAKSWENAFFNIPRLNNIFFDVYGDDNSRQSIGFKTLLLDDPDDKMTILVNQTGSGDNPNKTQENEETDEDNAKYEINPVLKIKLMDNNKQIGNYLYSGNQDKSHLICSTLI